VCVCVSLCVCVSCIRNAQRLLLLVCV